MPFKAGKVGYSQAPLRLVGATYLTSLKVGRIGTLSPPKGVLEPFSFLLLRTRLTGQEELFPQWDRQLLPPRASKGVGQETDSLVKAR